MQQIRVGVFETNSSSTHSLTIVSEEEYEKWKKGELLLHKYNDELVPLPEGYVPDGDNEDLLDELELQTYEAWTNIEMESFTQRYTSKSGDKIVAFGTFGYSG